MKKLITFLFVFIVSVSSALALSGCSLVTENTDKYYQEVVAQVGSKTVTREEVLNAYNNYSFYTYYGYSEKQVFDMVYNMLINQKILVQEAEKLFELNITEQNEIWETVRITINGYLDTYEAEVRALHNAEEMPEAETEEDEEIKELKDYERTTISNPRKDTDTVLVSGFEAPKKADNFYRYLAYNKYVSLLQKQSVVYGYNLSREQALQKEIDRQYNSAKDSKLVELYQEYIKGQLTISEQEIVDKYTTLLNKQIQKYAVDGEYNTAVTTTTGEELVLYHDDLPGSYFYTHQILIQFSDEAKEILKNHSGYVVSIDSSYTVDEEIRDSYLALREELAKEIEITYTDQDGEEQKINFAQIWADLNDLVEEYETSGKTQEQAIAMAKKFFEYKFYYSSDKVSTSSGTVNADTKSLDSLWNLLGYVFASDSSEKNNFAKEFSNAAYELYDAYNADQTFAINYAVTDYGVHFMMFTGLTPGGPVAESNYESLSSTKVSIMTNQTIADYIYELLLKEKGDKLISERLSALNSEYYKDNKIIKHYGTYEDFIKM